MPQRRAARWDGVFPIPHGDERITPDILRDVVAYVREQRANDSPFDVIVADHIGERDRPGIAATITAYADDAGKNSPTKGQARPDIHKYVEIDKASISTATVKLGEITTDADDERVTQTREALAFWNRML